MWDGFIAPEWLTLLAGDGKLGKSTLVYGLLGALESGASFGGRLTRETGAVVLSEEPPGTILTKIRRFGGGSHSILPRNEARTVKWAERVEQTTWHAHETGRGLIVVDTLSELAGLRGEEENDAGAVLDALDPLKAAAESGLAVLILHHTRKSGGSHGQGVRGSSAFVTAVNVATTMKRGAFETERVLESESHHPLTPTKYRVALTEDGFVRSGTTEEEDFARILAALDEVGAASVGDLVKLTGITKSTLDRRLKKLEGARHITSTGLAVKGAPVLWSRVA